MIFVIFFNSYDTNIFNNIPLALLLPVKIDSIISPAPHLYIFIMHTSMFLDKNISQFIIRYNQSPQPLPLKRSKAVSMSSDLTLKHKKISNSSRQPPIPVPLLKPIAKQEEKEREREQPQREYSRVPIQYMDQRDNGCYADKVRGRVVYRGYAPKNTFFFFKTLKSTHNPAQTPKFSNYSTAKSNNHSPMSNPVLIQYRGQQVLFNSKFQSGNLHAAVKMASRQYWLFMREDTNTHGLRQWFYLTLVSRRTCTLKLRIYKFSKHHSLYRMGMKPFIKVGAQPFIQGGQKIKYQYDSQAKGYYLQFQYKVEGGVEVAMATLPPYTYSRVTEWLSQYKKDQRILVKNIGVSLGGLDILGIRVAQRTKAKKDQTKDNTQLDQPTSSTSPSSLSQSPPNPSPKQAIIILCRTHPGQTVSNHSLQSFLSTALTLPLLSHYNIYIIPLVNPDGVFLGNHRTGVLGQDLNRLFHLNDSYLLPQIDTVQNYVAAIAKRYNIAFLLDLHGHSAKRNIFAYGQQSQIGKEKYLSGRVLPKILSNMIDSFKYDHCVFKATRQKKNTARVHFSSSYSINAITFQQSYGLLQTGCIGINHWKNFGSALAQSLVVYFNLTKTSPLKQIGRYMQGQIKQDKQAIEKKIRMKAAQQMEKQKIAKQQEQMHKRTKTQGFQDSLSGSKSMREIFKRFKSKQDQQQLTHIKEQQQSDHQLQQQRQHKTSNPPNATQQDSLSSGDQSLQMRNHQIQLLGKDIIRAGITPKQIIKRQPLAMAQKKVQLQNYYHVGEAFRLHHKQSSMAQRIYRFRSRQKTKEDWGKGSGSQRAEKVSSIQLPAIRK